MEQEKEKASTIFRRGTERSGLKALDSGEEPLFHRWHIWLAKAIQI